VESGHERFKWSFFCTIDKVYEVKSSSKDEKRKEGTKMCKRPSKFIGTANAAI